jgi:CheY-like chemotaxis protein
MTVLYAEDDQDDIDLLSEAMAAIDAGIICNTVSNGREVLEYLRKAPTLPDVIFLDINMPIMNGLTCLNDLKKHPKYKHIPVVMYTTSDKELEYIDAISSGAAAFLKKPSSFDALVKYLHEALQKIAV